MSKLEEEMMEEQAAALEADEALRMVDKARFVELVEQVTEPIYLGPSPPQDCPEYSEPEPTPDPKPPRAWQVPYGNIGIFSVVGTSLLEVVKMIENLKKDYADSPHSFAPLQVLNHGPRHGVDTAWLLPALFLGVFAEYEEPEAHPVEDFIKHLANSQESEIIEVDPAHFAPTSKDKENPDDGTG